MTQTAHYLMSIAQTFFVSKDLTTITMENRFKEFEFAQYLEQY